MSHTSIRVLLNAKPRDRVPAGLGNAVVTVVRTEGFPALYKGLAPTLVGIAPYAAINFASYDLLKRHYYGDGSDRRCVPDESSSQMFYLYFY